MQSYKFNHSEIVNNSGQKRPEGPAIYSEIIIEANKNLEVTPKHTEEEIDARNYKTYNGPK